MNQKQKSQPMKVGFLLGHYCPTYLLPKVFIAQITKPISLNYCCIAAYEPGFVFWGSSKAVKPQKVFGG